MKQLISVIITITAFSLLAQAQNDPKYVQGQQYYIEAHNIDQVWNTTKGSSNTRIAINLVPNHPVGNALQDHPVRMPAGGDRDQTFRSLPPQG